MEIENKYREIFLRYKNSCPAQKLNRKAQEMCKATGEDCWYKGCPVVYWLRMVERFNKEGEWGMAKYRSIRCDIWGDADFQEYSPEGKLLNVSDDRKIKTMEKLQDKKYRDSFVSSNIDIGVAFQIRALRKQRNYTRKKLAEIIGVKQETISALENPDKSPNISILKRIASALDVGLSVRFVSMGELIDRQFNLSNNSLEVPSFNEDKYFKKRKG